MKTGDVLVTKDYKKTAILNDVLKERARQEELKKAGKFDFTCADPEMDHFKRLAVLGEEYGEVSHEINEGIGNNRFINEERLRKELIQVSAVCLGWLEALDSKS